MGILSGWFTILLDLKHYIILILGLCKEKRVDAAVLS